MRDTAVLALSNNFQKLYNNLLKTLDYYYSKSEISEMNIYLYLQKYNKLEIDYIVNNYPVNVVEAPDKPFTSISKLRQESLDITKLFDNYDYLIMIDDDFRFGQEGWYQYEKYVEELRDNRDIGLIACHRRIKAEDRLSYTPSSKYPYDLSAISMRTGLIIRTSVAPPDVLFNPYIEYHEEFYLALIIYVLGYDIRRGWVDIYHQSRVGGLGNTLQKKYGISSSNEAPTAKLVAIRLGLFTVPNDAGIIWYGDRNIGRVSELAHIIHDYNKNKRLGLPVDKFENDTHFIISYNNINYCLANNRLLFKEGEG